MKAVDICRILVDFELGEWSWATRELFLKGLDMIQVHMSISNGVNKVTRLATRDMSHHVSEQSVRRNVKRNTQAHVSTSLIHLARKLILLHVDIKLAKHVAWRQRHFIQVGWVPGRHDDSSVLWIVNDLVDAVLELVNALSSVVRVHINIFGSKVTPLKTVDWSQVSLFAMTKATRFEKLFRAIAVPDMNVLVGKVIGVGVSLC